MFCRNCGAKIVDGAAFCVQCGAPIPVLSTTGSSENQTSNESVPVTNASITQTPVAPTPAPARSDSYFDGSVLQLIGWSLLGWLVSVVSLGIASPLASYWIYKWETEHTVINGKRLVFTGSAGGYFGTYLLGILLSIVTLGIYSFYFPFMIKKWTAKYTFFEGESVPVTQNASYFDGGFWQYFGWSILTGLLTITTLGICAPWASCLLLRWENKHTVYSKKRLSFDGTGLQFIGTWLLCILLTVVTFGIYGLWVPIRLNKWFVSHTHVAGDEDSEPVSTDPNKVKLTVKQEITLLVAYILSNLFIVYSVDVVNPYGVLATLFNWVLILAKIALIVCFGIFVFTQKKSVFDKFKYVTAGLLTGIMFVKSIWWIIELVSSNSYSFFYGASVGITILVNMFVGLGIFVAIAFMILPYLFQTDKARKLSKILVPSISGAIFVVAVVIQILLSFSIIDRSTSWFNSDYNSDDYSYSYSGDCDHSYYSFDYDCSSYMSEHLESGYHVYDADNLGFIGPDPWIPDSTYNKNGIGEYVTLYGRNDPHLSLVLRNGFQKSDYYEKNARVASIEVTVLETGSSGVYYISDTQSAQVIDIRNLLPSKKNYSYVTLNIRILDAYRGYKYQDLCIDSILPYFIED